MPFGLKNSQGTFQRIIDNFVRKKNINDIKAYVDNIIVASKTVHAHMEALEVEDVFKWLVNSNLFLRVIKCQLGFKEISLLGYIVNGIEMRLDPANVEKLKKFPIPRTKCQIQQFMGIANLAVLGKPDH